jgi:hypothetical protein
LKPKVKKCCAIFESKGEKRLGDHVLVGLESCLQFLCCELELQAILDAFPAGRKPEPNIVTETWVASLEGNLCILLP